MERCLIAGTDVVKELWNLRWTIELIPIPSLMKSHATVYLPAVDSACTIRDSRLSCRSSYCDSVGSQHIFGLQGVNTAIAEG
jgi:hypothetical protein